MSYGIDVILLNEMFLIIFFFFNTLKKFIINLIFRFVINIVNSLNLKLYIFYI